LTIRGLERTRRPSLTTEQESQETSRSRPQPAKIQLKGYDLILLSSRVQEARDKKLNLKTLTTFEPYKPTDFGQGLKKTLSQLSGLKFQKTALEI
jgi:hypothetical protein